MISTKSVESLTLENQFLREILDDVSDGIYAVTKDGEIVVYNKFMEKIEGTDRHYVLGYKDTEVYNIFAPEDYLRKEVFATGKPVKDRRITYYMPTGYKVEMVTNAYPHYEDGKIVAVYCIMQDIGGINQLQERIISLNSLLSRGTEKSDNLYPNGTKYHFPNIIGTSQKLIEAIGQARQIATSAANVLIYGETGTGKELFSQSIHNASHYKDGPFVAVNCASIPSTLLESQLFGTVVGAFSDARNTPGFFEQAENGTLFLDEINSMDINLQAKLLRVLQDKTICRLGDKNRKRINCRIICATNKNPLEPEFKENFREDLLYRLMNIVLIIPPLRERKEDIPVLCEYFLAKLNETYNTRVVSFADDFMELLISHHWPGNVRQLESLLENCVCYLDIKTNVLKTSHIPAYLKQQFPIKTHYYNMNDIKGNKSLNTLLNQYEKSIIEETIGACGGNLSQAAGKLGISRQNMNYRLKKFKIQTERQGE
ncbi:MAG TPA: sigma 54-interacting transcriptional regulator [Clostridiales bacterium]|nr:sigma 54-interacting transcriptional regulator [Clostridiales bacterium]